MEYKCLQFIFKLIKQPKDVPKVGNFLYPMGEIWGVGCSVDVEDRNSFSCCSCVNMYLEINYFKFDSLSRGKNYIDSVSIYSLSYR